MLEAGRWGRLVPVGDVESMTRAIQETLDGQASAPPHDLVVERYGMSRIVDRYLEVLVP